VIKLSLVPGVETPVILVGAETGTREGVTVGEAILSLPRFFAAEFPHDDTSAVREMLDDVIARTTGQLGGRVQRRVIGIAHVLDELLHDTLFIHN
jgi:hypothetical protein